MPAASSEQVFITVGTSLDPFDRLLRMVDDLCAAGRIPRSILAQTGACRYRPRCFPTVPFLPADELMEHTRSARVVICHGGAGSIGTCLLLRRRPVVVPRRVAHGEIVNDHQLELCRRMAKEGRIYLAEDPESLAAAIGLALRGDEAPPPPGGDRLRAAIAAILTDLASH